MDESVKRGLVKQLAAQVQKTVALRASETEFALLLENQLVILKILQALIEDR